MIIFNDFDLYLFIFVSMKPIPSLMSITHFARQCGVRPETARRWIAQGRGPALVVVGKRQKVQSDDFLAWLAARRIAAPVTVHEET